MSRQYRSDRDRYPNRGRRAAHLSPLALTRQRTLVGPNQAGRADQARRTRYPETREFRREPIQTHPRPVEKYLQFGHQ